MHLEALRRTESPQPRWPSSRSRIALALGGAFLWLAGTPGPIEGLDPERRISQYLLTRWGERQGLPQSTVLDLAQTTDGYLWLATLEGLVSFDGTTLTTFDRRSHPELPSHRVTRIAAAPSGDLFVGTAGGGLQRFDRRSFHSVPAPLGDGLSVWDLATTTDGTLWVGTPQGVLALEPGARALAVALAGVRARSLHVAPDGRLWVGAEDALWVGGGDGFARLALPVPLRGPLLRIPGIDADGSVWVTDEPADRTFVLHPPDYARASLVPGLDGSTLLAMRRDRDGNRWLLTDGLGLWRWAESGEPERLGEAHGLGSDVVLALLEDREGSLWIGTDGGGVVQLRDGKIVGLSARQGLSGSNVLGAWEDAAGSLWIGTNGDGLNRVVGPVVEVYHAADGLDNEFVFAFAEDARGDLWMGTCHGVVRWHEGRIDTPPGVRDLFGACVRALLVDRSGQLWAGSDLGLYRIADDRGERFDLGFRHQVSVLLEDRRGVLWAGEQDGLFRVEGGVVRRARDVPLDGRAVRTLYEDAEGVVWIGTAGDGLFAWRNGLLGHLTTAEGLPDDLVSVFLDDGLGSFWLCSHRGLARMERRALLAALAGGTAPPVERFDTSDGMPSRECNGGFHSAGLVDSRGRVWVPTIQGLAGLDPRSIPRNELPPPVLVEKVRVDGRPVPTEVPVLLPPGRHEVVVSIAATSLVAPERVRFRHRLEGLEEGWIEGTSRTITYGGLPPGRYTLRLEAANADGVWNRDGARLALVQQPAFHQTTAFPVLLVLAVALAGSLGYRLRVRALRRRAAELEQLVTERTRELDEARRTTASQATRLAELDAIKNRFFANLAHELRTPLTLNLGPLEELREGRTLGAARYLETAYRNARRLAVLFDELLELARLEAGRPSLDPEPCHLDELVASQARAFASLGEQRGVTITVERTGGRLVQLLDRTAMEKVASNLLGNAVKYVPAGGTVEVTLLSGDEWVGFRVADDGPGIPRADLERIFDRFYRVAGSESLSVGSGIGLALAHELVVAHGGTILVDSEPGRGTCFEVRLPRHDVEAEAETGTTERDARAAVESATPGPPAAATADARGERPLALVVDDHPELLEYLVHSLGDAFRVETAGDGVEALERLEELAADLVISDVMMPRLDGFGLCRALREREELSHLPLILLTARSDAESRLEGLAVGADDYVAKPFGSRELLARAENLVEGRRRLRRRYRESGLLHVEDVAATPLDERFLLRAKRVVEERLEDPDLDVAGFASALAMSPRHLQRKLRALVDETPRAFIRRLRLERAHALLESGAGSVTEVALAVGFSDASAFSRAFRRSFDATPSRVVRRGAEARRAAGGGPR